ncbi:hypothetical protein C6A87_022875 [Mycobacterium sp. ITM-2016-00317]|uniref:hypothetical protein n=1 Tax=Mycobacterium sp. ITM-2016-00317 TaxID=2099694 RepID=UPI000D4CDE47|nr:hypothetical protein [Mycobacterium sp. ITM-2016-00317]WNG86635.1 hypothetical protein C6A87_022875 [Mycobacterium sp. ITM-2016-00317]
MRKSYYAIPFLVAAGVFTALTAAPLAGATPALSGPLPTEYPWCELDLYCYDDDIDIALNPARDRRDVEYGGGSAFGGN